MNTIRKIFGNKKGATAIEYGLIAALIAVVIITVLGTIGTNLNTKLQAVSDGLEGKKS